MAVLVTAVLTLVAVDTHSAAASVRRVPVTKETAGNLPLGFRVTATEEARLTLFTVTASPGREDPGEPREVALWVLREGRAVTIAPLEVRVAEDGSGVIEFRSAPEAAKDVRVAWHYALSAAATESETIYEVDVASFVGQAGRP